MTISLRLNEAEAALMKQYAQMKRMTVSEMVRTAVLERIEDEYDLEAYHKAYEEYVNDPATLSLDEMEKELGL